jgi:predicted HTH transcriptional regulator
VEAKELVEILNRGEDSRHQFKENLSNADELPVSGATLRDVDLGELRDYYKKRYEEDLEDAEIDRQSLLANLGLAREGEINLAGLMLFGKHPQQFKPAYLAKAISFPGDAIDEAHYLDSEEITGNLLRMYQRLLGFVLRHLHRRQGTRGVNEPGQLEIPRIALEELLVNALVHRDYFISAPVRLFVFSNRIEIVSPGHLPNHLTPEQVRCGLSNMRNPRIASHASQILPYRGLGTGIPRALRAYPDIDIEDDRAGNQFKVTVWRRE